MNIPNSSDLDYKLRPQITSTKNTINQEILKVIPSNQKTINFSKDESNSNFLDIKNNKPYYKQKEYITSYENEDIEDEEEEINSDEYISSTNLDVETETYINMSNDTKTLEDIKNKNINRGKIKKKEKEKDNLNSFILNNIATIVNEKEIILNNNPNNIKNNINNSNDNNIQKVHHKNNKSDFFINKTPSNMSKGKNKNSKDKKGIFTPNNNNSKKKFKILRDSIIKKLGKYKNKDIYTIMQQSNTIKIIENTEDNKYEKKKNLKSNNNDMTNQNNVDEKINIKYDINLNKHKRNRTSRVIHNNSISIISNGTYNANNNSNNNNSKNNNISNNSNNISNSNNKHISIKSSNGQQHKNNNINIYNKNLIKDIGQINIDDQKYHLIPQTIKKVKTQGRIGRIVYSNQNKRNNLIYISNNFYNNSNINKTINSPLNKKKNRISPINHFNNVKYFNSICISKNKKLEDHHYLKNNNIHSLKNLKTESLQKSIKKYLLENDDLKLSTLNNYKSINNTSDGGKIKLLKDIVNKKLVKRSIPKNTLNNKNNNFINNNKNQVVNINSGENSKKKFTTYQSEQLLNTISNNQKRVDLYNNFKNNLYEIIKNKNNINNNANNNNASNNINTNIKKENKKRELSFIYPQGNNIIKNVLSLKKIKNNKINFIAQNTDINVENGGRNTNTNNYYTKKNKPLTTRIKLDLIAEENKNKIKKNKKKNIYNNNVEDEGHSHKKNNSNSSTKKLIYIDNSIGTNKQINSKSLLYNSLSPNYQSIKHLINKGRISNIKEIYNNINYTNNGRNTYNIYITHNLSRVNNLNNLSNSNNSNVKSNSNNKILYKKIYGDNVKNKCSNGGPTINYNYENIPEYPRPNMSTQNKKVIIFNNVNNYNLNEINNTMNNINNNNHKFKKTIEILSPFSSINNKNRIKKFYKNKNNNNQLNNNQNIIFLDNMRNKNNYSNKYLYNKNIMNKMKRNDNLYQKYKNNNVNSTQFSNVLKLNNKINNNFRYISNSNDRERNTISNKSYGELNLNISQNNKNNNQEKNATFENIFSLFK